MDGGGSSAGSGVLRGGKVRRRAPLRRPSATAERIWHRYSIRPRGAERNTPPPTAPRIKAGPVLLQKPSSRSPSAAGFLAARLGLGLRFSRALLSGLLELGNGVSALHGLDAAPRNLALSAFLLGFGGLSVQCQTLAAIEGTGMGAWRGFTGKLLHGALSAGLVLAAQSFLHA